MSVDELRELIRQIVAEQREYLGDKDRFLGDSVDSRHARYLACNPDKMQSELKACFIGENGVKA